MITWNNISSDTLHVIVEAYPRRTITKKKINVFSVPGRTGDIIDDEMAFENYEQKYAIFIEGSEANKLPYWSKKIAEWLMEPNGYAKLEDTYDDGTFRMAYYQGPMDVESWFNIHGQAEIEFICDPRRYLTEGQSYTTYTSGSTINNPTKFVSRPVIQFIGTTGNSGYAEINGVRVTINSLTNQMYLDCQSGHCYSGSVDKNASIRCGELPYLSPGNNSILLSGLSSVKIMPRWWKL